MQISNNERIVLDDMTVFIFWESFIGSKNMKDEDWRWKIAREYAKKVHNRSPNKRDIEKVYNKMKYRFKQFVKLGLFDVFKNGDGKEIYSLRETDILFKKVRFQDKQEKRSLIIRIED